MGLREQLLPEHAVLHDVEGFWIILNEAQTQGSIKVLDIGRKGYANLCFWNESLGTGGVVIAVNTDVAVVDMVGVSLEERKAVMSLILSDPTDYHVQAEVRKTSGSAPVDFMVLDGLCDYETIKGDFEMYQTLVRPGGKIALGNANDPQILKFWEEIPYQKKNYYADGAGVGIVGL